MTIADLPNFYLLECREDWSVLTGGLRILKEDKLIKARVARLFGLSEEECDLVNRIVIEEILAESNDTHDLIRRALDRFAKTEGERMAFLAGHITGWVLMKADMDMDIDSHFADSRSKGPKGQNT